MSEWDSASGSRELKMKSLSRLVPDYDYSGEDTAHRTDENFCRLVMQNLSDTRGVMFNILQTAFELHRDLLIREFERVRDEMEVFSDEIKARAFSWDPNKSHKWLGRLVDYDFRILSELGNLRKDVGILHSELLDSGPSLRDARHLDSHASDIKKKLDSIIVKFREREVVCNISEEVLERTFDSIRARIAKGV